MSALPFRSDVHLLGDGQSVIYLYAEVSDSTLHLGMAKEQLNGPEIASAPVDQRCLGAAQRVCTEQRGVQANAGDPFRYQARVLPGRQTALLISATREQEMTRSFSCCLEIIVDGLTCLFGDLELDRTTSLPLAHRRTIDRVSFRPHQALCR